MYADTAAAAKAHKMSFTMMRMLLDTGRRFLGTYNFIRILAVVSAH